MRVLITDGDTRQALAATRSLGRSGHVVVVAAKQRASLAGSSRYCASRCVVPSPLHGHQRFAQEVASAASQLQIDVVLPMTEVSTFALTLERARLPRSCILPFPSHESVVRANDKGAVLRLARELAVPTPATREISSPTMAVTDLESMIYPIVVKPAVSRVLTDHGWVSNSVSYANDAHELRRRLASLNPGSFPVLLQERIVGSGVGIFMLFDRGKCAAEFSHRRIREKPPSGGVSVLSESMPIDPVAGAHARALLASLEWHGPAMVEFKRDERDATLRLMEINGRFWGSLQLAIDAGVDFPSLLVALGEGSQHTEMPPYRNNVRCRWLAGDLDSLAMILLKRRQHLNLAPSHPTRLRSLIEFVRFWDQDLRYELERWDDPGPAILEWRRKLLWQ